MTLDLHSKVLGQARTVHSEPFTSWPPETSNPRRNSCPHNAKATVKSWSRRRCSFRSACVTTRPHGAPRSTPLRTSQTSCHGLHRSCQRGGRPRPWLECSVLCCVPGAVSPRDGGSPPPREADAISPTAPRGPRGTGTGEPCPAVGEESRGGQGAFSFREPEHILQGYTPGVRARAGATAFVNQNRPRLVCAARALTSLQKWAPHTTDAGSPPTGRPEPSTWQEQVLREPRSAVGAGRPGVRLLASGPRQAWTSCS